MAKLFWPIKKVAVLSRKEIARHGMRDTRAYRVNDTVELKTSVLFQHMLGTVYRPLGHGRTTASNNTLTTVFHIRTNNEEGKQVERDVFPLG